MKPKPTFTRIISEKEWAWTILALALLFGSFVRIMPALIVDFPINDGGMFSVMIDDLIQNHWLPPLETTYNHSHIPFVYPPFGFYFGAVLRSLGMGINGIFLWIPALLSILILPAFYFFALEFFNDRSHAAAAAAFLALAPGTYVWYLMGGGLTRALGAIFFLMAMTFTLRAFRTPQRTPVLLAAFFAGLTLLTHPQAALMTLTGCFILWLIHGRSYSNILRAMSIALGAALVSSLWWGDMIARHGLETLLSAGQSGRLLSPWLSLFAGLTLRQTILPFATIFWLLGIDWCVYIRRIDLLLMAILLYFIDERTAPAMSFYALPLLAAYGFMDALPSIFSYFRNKKWEPVFDQSIFNHPAFSMSLLGIIFYLFIECAFHTNVIVKLSLPSSARELMAWVQENAKTDSRYLIVTGREDAMTDPVQEWFPVLAGHYSVTTLQGSEWTLAGNFNRHWDELNALQSCENEECIISFAKDIHLEFTHIIININEVDPASFEAPEYSILYQNGQNVVFENKKP